MKMYQNQRLLDSPFLFYVNMEICAISSLIKKFSLNHAICIQTLYCSVRFIICGMVLKFLAIIHY